MRVVLQSDMTVQEITNLELEELEVVWLAVYLAVSRGVCGGSHRLIAQRAAEAPAIETHSSWDKQSKHIH